MSNNQTKDILESIKKTVSSYYEQSSRLLDADKNIITLTEDGADAKCTSIKFQINGEILIYKFDKKDDEQKDKHPLLFLEKTTPLRSLVDYIIFYHKNTKKGNKQLYAIICNMKSEKAGNMDDQMLSGSILADFIYKTAARCHNSWNSSNNNKILLGIGLNIKEIAIFSKHPSEGYSNVKDKDKDIRKIVLNRNKSIKRITLKGNKEQALNLDNELKLD